MNFKYLPTSVLVVWLLFATSIRAEENPMDDPDLQQLLKQAQEMQKSSGSPDTRKKLAEMEAMAKQEAAQQEQEEKDEKEKLQAALKKQLDAPGPVAFPDWMPVTPEFKPAGKPAKKVVDEEVKIVQTGTSSLTPEKIAESWQSAATAANNLNQSLNKMNVNGKDHEDPVSQHAHRSQARSGTRGQPRAGQQRSLRSKFHLPCPSRTSEANRYSALPNKWLSC